MQVVNFWKYVHNNFSCLPSWWGLLCGRAYCARAHCAHWVIRPCFRYSLDDFGTGQLRYIARRIQCRVRYIIEFASCSMYEKRCEMCLRVSWYNARTRKLLLHLVIVSVGLPVSDNWTFFARLWGWWATNEYRLESVVLEGAGSLWSKDSGRRGHPHQPFVHG